MAGDRKGKKPKLAAADDEPYEQLDGSIEKLQEIQDELEKIDEEVSEKIREIERKYSEVRRPIYDKRVDIIKEIHAFWKTAFLGHPSLCHLLTEDDVKVFEFLESIDVTDSKDDKYGYSITFSFSPNPYFENEKLTKTVAFDDDGSMKLTGTNIKWKEEVNLANGAVQTKKGEKRLLVEESFFTFFSEDENLSDINQVQDEVAELIKEDLWPNPLKYFDNEEDEDGDSQEEYAGDENNDDGDENNDDGENGNGNAGEDSSGNDPEDGEDEENNK